MCGISRESEDVDEERRDEDEEDADDDGGGLDWGVQGGLPTLAVRG